MGTPGVGFLRVRLLLGQSLGWRASLAFLQGEA